MTTYGFPRPCLTCGVLSPQSYCPDHRRKTQPSKSPRRKAKKQFLYGGNYKQKANEIFEKLKLAPYKKIVPLAMNWAGIDKPMILDWLGTLNYQYIFSHKFRDLMVSALFANDRAFALGRPYPFTKYSLTGIANDLNITHERSHNALDDCLKTAECYRTLMSQLT